MSRLIRNKKLIGSTSNDSSHIIYDPSDTSRSETTVKSELDRLNAGIPAVDVGNATTDWTDTETAISANQGNDNYNTLNAMSPSSTIKSLLTSIKSLLFGLSTQVTSLNTRLTELDIVSGVDGYCAYRKYGKVVTLVINGITNITPQGVVLSHLPDGLHPSSQRQISITVAISGVFYVRQGLINTAGEVIIYGANESNVSLWDSVTYII